MSTPLDPFGELEFVIAAGCHSLFSHHKCLQEHLYFYCYCSFACLQGSGRIAVRVHLCPLTSISPAYEATCQMSVFWQKLQSSTLQGVFIRTVSSLFFFFSERKHFKLKNLFKGFFCLYFLPWSLLFLFSFISGISISHEKCYLWIFFFISVSWWQAGTVYKNACN